MPPEGPAWNPSLSPDLLEKVLERENPGKALERVEENQGKPGMDPHIWSPVKLTLTAPKRLISGRRTGKKDILVSCPREGLMR